MFVIITLNMNIVIILMHVVILIIINLFSRLNYMLIFSSLTNVDYCGYWMRKVCIQDQGMLTSQRDCYRNTAGLTGKLPEQHKFVYFKEQYWDLVGLVT